MGLTPTKFSGLIIPCNMHNYISFPSCLESSWNFGAVVSKWLPLQKWYGPTDRQTDSLTRQEKYVSPPMWKGEHIHAEVVDNTIYLKVLTDIILLYSCTYKQHIGNSFAIYSVVYGLCLKKWKQY